MLKTAPVSRPLSLLPRLPLNRAGIALPITLGILTVLSIMAISFLLSARLRRESTVTNRNLQTAQDALPIALATAMRQIEESLTYPNFTEDPTMQFAKGQEPRFQRLAPVNHWFPAQYAETNNVNPNISFQHGAVLTSPTFTNAPSINLLTPEVLAMVPPALTNGLPLSASESQPLRSGWIPSDMLNNVFADDSLPLDIRLENKPARIAFAIFDCSGTIDANVFPERPTAKKTQRRYFSQYDVTRAVSTDNSDIEGGTDGDTAIISYMQTNNLALPDENLPFFHTSYDPGPNTYRYDINSPRDILGNDNFKARKPLDLNNPTFHKALTALTSGNLAYHKFNINSITNYLSYNATAVADQWYTDAEFNLNWLLPVTTINQICLRANRKNEPYAVSNPASLAWNIANFIDPDRTPQKFNLDGSAPATRVNYMVEDLPLINKISIFDIYEDEAGPSDKVGNLKYYNADPTLSNHYAVAVEVWYPFAPTPPPDEREYPACYVGIYTNEADVVTSTNRPLSDSELQRWLEWLYAETSNSVMQVLFESWGRSYRQRVGELYLSNHPLWQVITADQELWFTTNMTSHSSWPQADTNGNFTLESAPIYQAFYPETFDVVTTNESDGVISTNTYTYMIATNFWMTSASVLGETNQFIYGEYFEDSRFTTLYWEDVNTGVITSNLLGSVITPEGQAVSMALNNNIALSFEYDETNNTQYVIYRNVESDEVRVTEFTSLTTAEFGDELFFRPRRGIFFTEEIFPVEPLYIPDDLQESLDALFDLLPTNNISELERFLMLTVEEMRAEDWDNLFDWFQRNPAVNNTMLPRIVEPSLGNLTEADRYSLVPREADGEAIVFFDAGLSEQANFQGCFWTIYPKKTVSFLEIEERAPAGAPPDSGETEIVTNCYALGAYMPGNQLRNTMWVRPAVTILGYDQSASEGEGVGATEVDKIVDEALLLPKENHDATVQGWIAVTNLYVPEPRDNAWASSWLNFFETWDSQNNQTNLSHGVKELPFVHFNRPLKSAGELGLVYTPYKINQNNSSSPADNFSKKAAIVAQDGVANPQDSNIAEPNAPYDTITFSMASGASLLDFYTTWSDKGARRGLSQANTALKPTLDLMLADIPLGWTNEVGISVHDPDHRWPELWCHALTNMPYNTGWRSYADMLPALATNEMHRNTAVMNLSGLHSAHDYTEDVLRGIAEKISFRQNIFVIVLAAQVIAPGTELMEQPNVLAEQRVAVTVIRDAYSGNWVISDWKKLTQ